MTDAFGGGLKQPISPMTLDAEGQHENVPGGITSSVAAASIIEAGIKTMLLPASANRQSLQCD